MANQQGNHGWEASNRYITEDDVKAIVANGIDLWRSRIRSGQPRLSIFGAEGIDAARDRILSATDAQTVRRRHDLRRVIDEILNVGWLRVYSHKDNVRARVTLLFDRFVPDYVPWRELVSDDLIETAACEELWQRDVGDALVALAIGGALFPDLRDACRGRIKDVVTKAIAYPTWGDQPRFTDMDLAAGHLAKGIAVACDWHADLWNAQEMAAVHATMRQKLGALLRGAYGAAFWARDYDANHCHIALTALGVCGAAFLDTIPEAQDWLAAAVVGYSRVAETCHIDGSSVEGVPYWTYGMTFICQYIELTRDIVGSDSLYQAPFLRNAFLYRLHCSLPNFSGTVTFGDAVPRDYYGPSHMFYLLARQYRNSAAQWLGDNIPFAPHPNPEVGAWTLLWRDPDLAPERPTSLETDIHLLDWDVAFTRSGWSADDYVVAVKAGFANRSHSHLDGGAFVFGWGDEWLVEAPGYGAAGPGFWDVWGERWTYYSNSTESHSTLLIDGGNQRFDMDARSKIDGFRHDDSGCWISVDMTEAYAGALKIRRQILHRKGAYVLILDEVEMSRSQANPLVEWLLQPGRSASVESVGRKLTIAGKSGSIEVISLASDSHFEPRPPTRKVDIPVEAVRTHSLQSRGSTVAFAVLIVPTRSDAAEGDVRAFVEEWSPGNRRVRVESPGIVDRLDSNGRSSL